MSTEPLRQVLIIVALLLAAGGVSAALYSLLAKLARAVNLGDDENADSDDARDALWAAVNDIGAFDSVTITREHQGRAWSLLTEQLAKGSDPVVEIAMVDAPCLPEALIELFADPATDKITPTPDAREIERLRRGLSFYAEGHHFDNSGGAFDTVSGEPANWWCDEAGSTVEDGGIARLFLDGHDFDPDDDGQLVLPGVSTAPRQDASRSGAP
ncbi:MAG TPA: hypothetical protein DEH78_05220 [Solibacterales bacterium]|nr:hypothetical protein [Bryobacterales bacterium]